MIKPIYAMWILFTFLGLQNLAVNTIGVNVYPNPTNGLFTIELNALTHIVITNSLGQTVFNETVNEGKQILTLKNQESGLYFVKLNQNGKQQTIKLIKN